MKNFTKFKATWENYFLYFNLELFLWEKNQSVDFFNELMFKKIANSLYCFFSLQFSRKYFLRVLSYSIPLLK